MSSQYPSQLLNENGQIKPEIWVTYSTHFGIVSMLVRFSVISITTTRAKKLLCSTENSSAQRKSEEKNLSENPAAYCDLRKYKVYWKQATYVAMDWTIPVNHRKIPGGATDH